MQTCKPMIAALALLGLGSLAQAQQGSLCTGICAADQRQCRQSVQTVASIGRPFADALIAANRSATESYRSPGLVMQQMEGTGQNPGQAARDERLHDCDSVQQACVASCAAEERQQPSDAAQAGASQADASPADASPPDAPSAQ